MATKEQEIAQLENKLKRLRAEAKRRDRRDETRRKILYGAAFLALTENIDPERRKNMMNQVERFISRPVDREFLGLSPSPAVMEKKAHNSPSSASTASLPFNGESS